MTTAVSRQNRTLIDALVPFSGACAELATVIIGRLVLVSPALPSAWTLYDRYDPRSGSSGNSGRGWDPDGNL